MSELNYREMKWHVEHIPERDCWSVFSDKGFAIATGFREKRSADLIAATPDLLRACEAVLAVFDDDEAAYSKHELNALRKCAAGITKAKGGQA